MHDDDVHEAIYLNCEIHDYWVGGTGPRVGPIWPHSEQEAHGPHRSPEHFAS